MARQVVDLTGLKCPLPIVRMNALIKELPVGDELQVTADDPAFRLDIEAWCRRTEHELVAFTVDGPRGTAVVRRSR